MISHDATIILHALCEAGGRCDQTVLQRMVEDTLMSGFAVSLTYLIDRGLVEQLNGAEPLNVFIKLTPKNTYLITQLHEAKLHEAKLHEAADPRNVQQLVAATINSKNFNSNYQAVVDGKKARRDPLVEYVAGLSRLNQVDAWKELQEMDEAEKNAIRSRVARFTS